MASVKTDKEEVQVRRDKLAFPTQEGGTREEIWITYTTRDLPPGILRIPSSEWTETKEIAAIKADVDARRKARPSTVRI